jgi:hypothetical protein
LPVFAGKQPVPDPLLFSSSRLTQSHGDDSATRGLNYPDIIRCVIKHRRAVSTWNNFPQPKRSLHGAERDSSTLHLVKSVATELRTINVHRLVRLPVMGHRTALLAIRGLRVPGIWLSPGWIIRRFRCLRYDRKDRNQIRWSWVHDVFGHAQPECDSAREIDGKRSGLRSALKGRDAKAA